MEFEQLQRAIEAILFASGEAIEASRLAAALETDVSDVNRLLKQFEQMQKMMKQLSGNGKQGKKMRQMLSQMENKGGFGSGMPF